MTEAYEELERIARTTPRAMPEIIVTFGSFGHQFAALRVSRARSIQCRRWRPNSRKGWTKWRKLQPAEVVRLATVDDRAKFKPDYGRAW